MSVRDSLLTHYKSPHKDFSKKIGCFKEPDPWTNITNEK